MIAEAVLAIEMGASAKDLALSIHPHPTLFREYDGMAVKCFLARARMSHRPSR